MSQRTPAKSNGSKAAAARTPAATPAAAAAAPRSAAKSASAAAAASGKKKQRAPSPEPEPEPEPAAEEDEEDASQYSEPEEVDNEGMMDEFSRNQPEDDDDAEDEDDGDEADGMSDEEEEEEAKAASASGKKRAFDGASASSSGGKKSKSKKDQAAPSNDEMQALRQTEDLFKSNLFKLQLEEMLKELDVGYDKLAKVEPILHGLKSSIESIPTQELSYDPRAPIFGAALPQPVMASVASSTAATQQQHSFPFHAPSTFNLVGSYPLKTLLRDASSASSGSSAASLNIDIVVEMPAACLKEKDYWDYRYLAKRARFLEHLAAHLMESGRFRVKIGKMRGASEKPVVLLYPLKEVEATQPAATAAVGSAKKKGGASAAAAAAPTGPSFQPFTGILSKVVIRLFVSLPAGLFNPKRFHPSKANLHAPPAAGSKGVKAEAAEDKNDAAGLAPTPYYNSLLLEDMFYTTHLATLYTLFSSAPALKEALLLLKLWTKQHKLDLGLGLAASNGGWGEFEVTREGSTSASKRQQQTKKEKGAATPAAASSSSPRVTLVDPTSYLLRGPAGACTGFNGFFLSMFLSHLMSTKQIYRSMSTYQLFKVALQSLVKSDMLASAPASSGEPGGVVHGFDPSKSMHSIALLTNPLAAASTPREVEMLRSWTASRGFEVLFLDAEGSINFASRISKQTYLELKQEAFLSLSYLDDSSTLMANIFGNGTTSVQLGENAATIAAAGASAANAPSASMVALQTLLATSRPLVSASSLGLDSFQTLFMTRSEFHSKFDAFVRVDLGKDAASWSKASREFQAKQANSFLSLRSGLAADTDALSMIVRQVSSLLELALGDRILLLHVQPLLSASGALTLEVGLMLNPFHANRILDMGPSADAVVPALHFRDLWGELSTLRRFKDGSIVEAVVWTTPSPSNAPGAPNVPHTAPHLIPFQIISFVLGRHLSIGAGSIHSVVSQLDSLLKLRAIESQPTAAQLLHRAGAGAPAPLLLSAPSVDPSFLHASTLFSTFKSLSAALKSLHAQIPLNIVNIRMVGEFSRYTSVFAAPVPVDLTQLAPNHPRHALVDVVPVLLQFESSSKWPEDSLAISRIKSAFYIQFGKALNAVHDVHSIVSLDALDILYHGFVFRLRIFYEAELAIRKVEEKMGLHSLGGPLIPVPSALEIQRDFIRLPLLSQQLKFVQETYPLFAPTVRIVKRWVSAHMFSPFFESTPESIELLVVGLFTNPKPYAVPASVLQGLHRWLCWISSFDFDANPVIVDLAGDMKSETIDRIHAQFTAARAKGEGSLIYVATEMDPEGSMLFPRVAQAPATSVRAAAALPEGAAAARGEESGIDGFVLSRLVAYARSSLAHFDALLAGGPEHGVAQANQWKTLFKTPLSVPSAFDLLIHLRVDALPVQYLTKSLAPPSSILASAAAASGVKPEGSAASIKKGYKLPPDAAVNASAITLSSEGCSDSRTVPLVGFNPLHSFVASLRHMFGALAYFFYDAQGGTVIGVVWRPEFRARIAAASSGAAKDSAGLLKWSVKNAAFAAPVHDKKTGKIEGLRLHVAEILADMKKAGTGLVDRIDTGALELAV